MSTTAINDENLEIPGYIMYCVDYPSVVKKDGGCIYYKTMLSLKVLSTNSLQKCINFEVSIRNKKYQFTHLYITSSQCRDESHDFLTNMEMNLDHYFNNNTFLTTVIVDFSAK